MSAKYHWVSASISTNDIDAQISAIGKEISLLKD